MAVNWEKALAGLAGLPVAQAAFGAVLGVEASCCARNAAESQIAAAVRAATRPALPGDHSAD